MIADLFGANASTLASGSIIGGICVLLVTVVTVLRRYKSGEIVDDDAVIARLDRDNANLRAERDACQREVDTQRALRWAAEDRAVEYRRRLAEAGLDTADDREQPK